MFLLVHLPPCGDDPNPVMTCDKQILGERFYKTPILTFGSTENQPNPLEL